MKYYKLTNNNMVVDLFEGEVYYVRYLPSSKRLIAAQQGVANGVRGSDGETIYHITGTVNTFPSEKMSVYISEIGLDEYTALSTQFSLQRKENEDLRKKMEKLESLVQQ